MVHPSFGFCSTITIPEITFTRDHRTPASDGGVITASEVQGSMYGSIPPINVPTAIVYWPIRATRAW